MFHVHDGNDDSNLILLQIFIVIAFVFHPLAVMFKWRPFFICLSRYSKSEKTFDKKPVWLVFITHDNFDLPINNNNWCDEKRKKSRNEKKETKKLWKKSKKMSTYQFCRGRYRETFPLWPLLHAFKARLKRSMNKMLKSLRMDDRRLNEHDAIMFKITRRLKAISS